MGNEKIVFSEILNSLEFNQFKLYLNKIQQSIETKDVSKFVDSINKLNTINQEILLKANKTQSLMIKKYFIDSSEFKDVIFFQLDKSHIFEIGFENYIPSYFNPETNQYSSLDLNLGKIDFLNKSAKLYNIDKSFRKPIKIQKKYLLSQKMKIDKLNLEIKELTLILSSKINIIKYIYTKEQSIINIIKLLLYNDYYEEYKNILHQDLIYKTEEINILNEELNKDNEYIYEEIFLKILKTQKYLEEVLEKENFKIEYTK